MKKTIWIIGVIIVVALVIILVVRRASPTTMMGQTIKIGGDLSLTGFGASWSENQLNGAQLAVKEINTRGGVLGKSLEFVAEDNATDPKTAVSALQKLIAIDHVNFLLTGWSFVTEPLVSLINENKILTVTVAAGQPGITKQSPYLFRTWPPDDIATRAIVEYASTQKYKKIIPVHTISQWENSITDFFVAEAGKMGLQTLTPVAFTADTQNFQTYIAKLKVENPDAIFLAASPGPLERFIKQARELGVNIPILYPIDVVGLGLPEKVSPSYLKDVIFTIYTPSKVEFVNSFKNEYGVEPGVSADTAYDAIYMLAKAIEKAGTSSH